MKKRIAYLLSFVLFISMCSINPTYIQAAEKTDLKYLANIGLKEVVGEGLKQAAISKDAEEATLQWSIKKGEGKYELVYYTDSINDNPSEKEQVTMDFKVNEKNEQIKKIEFYPCGLVMGTYIIAQNDDAMYLIDQHAAQERINY